MKNNLEILIPSDSGKMMKLVILAPPPITTKKFVTLGLNGRLNLSVGFTKAYNIKAGDVFLVGVDAERKNGNIFLLNGYPESHDPAEFFKVCDYRKTLYINFGNIVDDIKHYGRYGVKKYSKDGYSGFECEPIIKNRY